MKVSVNDLTPEAYEPFGTVIGKANSIGPVDAYESETIAFWHEHIFSAGPEGETELLWVTFKPQSRPLILRQMERHLKTEQALIPISGRPLVHVVASPKSQSLKSRGVPEPEDVRAFMLDGDLGVCMNPGVWHAQMGLFASTTHLMITRRSTTIDLLESIVSSARKPIETTFVTFEPPISLALKSSCRV